MSDDENKMLAALARLEAGQGRLQAGQGRLESRLTLLEVNQAKLRGDLGGWMERVSDKLTEMREQIVVSFGATEHVGRANETTREDLRNLREMVNVLFRKVIRLEGKEA